ncbi:MAG: hypothetical protein M5U14_06400 [Acidimicrobiia bacterium]|nr:hypothetical protein [Acidimicrobiia bacterium]
MAVLVVPVSAAMVALAQPFMRVVVFGRAAEGEGVGLLAAGMASLAVGLFAYGAFLLATRAYYALGDSRTPAVVALVSAVIGVAVMLLSAPVTEGAARVAALGLGHSVAQLAGMVALLVGLSRRTGHAVVPGALARVAPLSAAVAALAWWVVEAVDPAGRAATAGLLTAVGLLGAGAYVGGLRVLGFTSRRHPAEPVTVPEGGA